MRKEPPTRDPQTPGYVAATMLADGDIPPIDVDGNFVVGPTHDPAPEMRKNASVPRGKIHELVMESKDSTIYPGIAREKNTFGKPDPENPARLIVTTPIGVTRELLDA